MHNRNPNYALAKPHSFFCNLWAFPAVKNLTLILCLKDWMKDLSYSNMMHFGVLIERPRNEIFEVKYNIFAARTKRFYPRLKSKIRVFEKSSMLSIQCFHYFLQVTQALRMRGISTILAWNRPKIRSQGLFLGSIISVLVTWCICKKCILCC